MAGDLPDTALELRSLVTSGGVLELSLHEVPVPTPGENEVLVRVEASPINPSDLGLLVASADMSERDGRGHARAPCRHRPGQRGHPGGAVGTTGQVASGGQ